MKYRYSVDGPKGHAVFESEKHYAPLTPVWGKLGNGVGYTVKCEGLDAKGVVVGSAGERQFTKTIPFRPGLCPPASRTYRECVRLICEYVINLPAVTSILEDGKPDPHYRYSSLISKTHASHINAMVRWAELYPDLSERIMRLARASGDYLLSELEPPDAPLAYWPPTYRRDRPTTQADRDRLPEGTEPRHGTVMTLYPAEAGIGLVTLYQATKDRKYLDAAVGIAETYMKTRRADGSWPLQYVLASGREYGRNTLVPTTPIMFFNDLHKATGNRRWADAAEACLANLSSGPLRDWNWEGQFEDVDPKPPYRDLAHNVAICTLTQLMERRSGEPSVRRQARELLDWCEDQFVFWEAPCGPEDFAVYPGKLTPYQPGRDHYPGVTEQYDCYANIDASAAVLMSGYLTMYRAERDPVDLAKAKALADSVTRIQLPNGMVPTFWSAPDSKWRGEDHLWLNCIEFTSLQLVELIRVVERESKSGDGK